MWYENVTEKLDSEKTYSRDEILTRLESEHPKLSPNSYVWFLGDLIKNGDLERVSRNEYVIGHMDKKPIYKPSYSDLMKKIIKKVNARYPMLPFTAFETKLLNEFLNHQIAQDTLFIQANRDSAAFVFQFLRDSGYGNVLINPKKDDYKRYWSRDCIVITPLTTEAPMDKSDSHSICMEKMLVDIYCDKLIKISYSLAEYPSILVDASSTYQVDFTRLLRYARRRGKEKEIRLILEERKLLRNAES